MKLKPKPFQQIRACTKVYELRLYDQKRQALWAGDTIVFTKLGNAETLTAKVLAIHVFPSFEELYKTRPLDKCGYKTEEMATANPKDMLQYYSEEQQAQWGVVGIEIEVLK